MYPNNGIYAGMDPDYGSNNMIDEGGPVQSEDSGAAKVVVELKEIEKAARDIWDVDNLRGIYWGHYKDAFTEGAIWMKERLNG